MSETNNVHGKSRYVSDFIFDMGMDLKLILLFTLAVLVFIYMPVLNKTILEPVLGIAMMFFIPGYAFVAALYPKKSDFDEASRAALSFGLSISITPIIELGLTLTPWGLRLEPLIVCLTAFTIICALAANMRRHGFQKEDRYSVDFPKAYKELKAMIFADRSGLEKALTAVLILSIVLSAAAVTYAVFIPKQTENFTELYVLGPNNTADSYPTSFSYGDSKPVIVGVMNHEYRNVTYDLVVLLNDSLNRYSLYEETMTIADNQSWKKPINLTPNLSGTNMKLEFLLYADGNMTAPYRKCYFWINVTNSTQKY